MAVVYYKFLLGNHIRLMPIEGNYITVGEFKDELEKRQHYIWKKDKLAICNADNEEYVGETTLIPKFSSVVIRRGPRFRLNTIVVANKQDQVEKIDSETSLAKKIDSETSLAEQSAMDSVDDIDIFDFGDDVYAIPEVTPSSNPVNLSKADEDSKIQTLVNTSALDDRKNFDGIGSGFGRGRGRGSHEQLKPPQGYVCHRCNTPGHFIQHCPTNGNPDIDKLKPPQGYVCHRCDTPGHFIQHCPTNGNPDIDIKRFNTVLKPNVSTFRNKVRGFPDSRSAGNLPPELYCLLCERVMKDAVFSKCCFQSFCENCIRDQVISKSNCVCGAKGRPENDFVPNNAVRDTIKRILETNYSGACNHDHGKQFGLPMALKGVKVPMQNVEATMIQGAKKEEEPLISEQKISVITIEPALQGSACAIPADKEVQHKEVTVDAGKEFAVPAVSVGGQAPLQMVEATNIQEDRNLEESLISQPGGSDTTKEPILQESAPPVDKELQHKEFANIGERKLEDESSIFRPEASGITNEPALQGSALETNKVQSKEVTKIQDSNLEEESPIVQPEASGIIKEQALQGSALSANNAQRKEVTVEMEKKKSKRKSNLPINAAEIQWTAQQYHAAQSYMQSIYPFSYNPYLNSMYPGMEAYMKQCGIIPPHMEYNIIPSNVPLGVPGMPSSQISPDSRESSKDRECNREIRKSVDATSVKLKHASNMILTPPPPSSRVQRHINHPRREQHHNERKEQSPQRTSSMTASKRKSSRHIDDHKDYDDSYHHKHHKELRHHHGTPSVARRAVIREHDSSDDKERHSKRRRSRYE